MVAGRSSIAARMTRFSFWATLPEARLMRVTRIWLRGIKSASKRASGLPNGLERLPKPFTHAPIVGLILDFLSKCKASSQ
jgi:hypothetical protein